MSALNILAGTVKATPVPDVRSLYEYTICVSNKIGEVVNTPCFRGKCGILSQMNSDCYFFDTADSKICDDMVGGILTEYLNKSIVDLKTMNCNYLMDDLHKIIFHDRPKGYGIKIYDRFTRERYVAGDVYCVDVYTGGHVEYTYVSVVGEHGIPICGFVCDTFDVVRCYRNIEVSVDIFDDAIRTITKHGIADSNIDITFDDAVNKVSLYKDGVQTDDGSVYKLVSDEFGNRSICRLYNNVAYIRPACGCNSIPFLIDAMMFPLIQHIYSN